MVVRGSACEAASWTSRRGDASVERRGDEGVPQGVRPDRLGDAGAAGDAAHNPAGVEALTDGEVDRTGGTRCERDGDDLAALAQHGEGAVPAFEAELVDVRAQGLGDTPGIAPIPFGS